MSVSRRKTALATLTAAAFVAALTTFAGCETEPGTEKKTTKTVTETPTEKTTTTYKKETKTTVEPK